MPIQTIAEYRVRPEGVAKVTEAIEEFVSYVKANEPGTRMYIAWHQQDDPTRFVHFFIFENKAAHEAHSTSDAVKRFEAAYRPEMTSGSVEFTDYDLVATNQDSHDIKHCIQIAAPPEKVHALVTSGTGFGKWWATDITESGDTAELGFFNRATIYRLRRTTDHPLHAEWVCDSGDQWKDTRIVFQMEATKTGTQLRFSHAGWREASDYFLSCNTTWGELMFRLKDAAEGHTPGPLFSREGMAY